MLRAWSIGVLVSLLFLALWIIAQKLDLVSWPILVGVQAGPWLAAALTAYLAPRSGVSLGTSMAVVSGVIAGNSQWIYELCGLPVDHVGLKGAFFFTLLNFVGNLIPCAIASLIGSAIKKRVVNRELS